MTTAALRVGWVVLTQGHRPVELNAAVDSIRQQSLPGNIVVVCNGTDIGLENPDGIDVLSMPHNIGVPAGRDLGIRHLDADVVFFLDDDARLCDQLVTQRVVERMRDDPELAVVGLRIVDEQGQTLRRHVPRMGHGSPERSGTVTLFPGGACAIRRDAYLAAGGYPVEFFYGHEELDLAWRLIDHGSRIWYDATAAVVHPHVEISDTDPTRWVRLGRNRVLLSRRLLPVPLNLVHPCAWLAIETIRLRDRESRTFYWRGWRSGWRRSVTRTPMTWASLWRMARLGRPPIV